MKKDDVSYEYNVQQENCYNRTTQSYQKLIFNK